MAQKLTRIVGRWTPVLYASTLRLQCTAVRTRFLLLDSFARSPSGVSQTQPADRRVQSVVMVRA